MKKENIRNLLKTKSSKLRRRSGLFSPITRRILAINILALGFLAVGILYLDEYKENLIEAELSGLLTQAEMFAVAISEGAVARAPSGRYSVSQISNQMVRRLVKTTGTRARLFGVDGGLIADSRRLLGSLGSISIETLPPPENPKSFINWTLGLFEPLVDQEPDANRYPLYKENIQQTAKDYPEVIAALSGDRVKTVRTLNPDQLILSVAVPVQRYKQVLGSLLVTKDSKSIDAALFETRRDILKVFTLALALTVLLSIYLARSIAHPLQRLADAAEYVRHDPYRNHRIPNMADRDDEIGELASTLNDMTDALWQRMNAIDQFAADVAHEIKNPLTSMRSAVETAVRLKDPKKQKKLMGIIQEDVSRLDRLISDISDASRLDSELSRAENKPLDIWDMLATLVDIHNRGHENKKPWIALTRINSSGPIIVMGIEGRLVQIFQNLITNAETFSLKSDVIRITISSDKQAVIIYVDDDGPGISPGNENKIFSRFYTERAETEKFGTHSGLGLSISLQIATAHRGQISAKNRKDNTGAILGARFTVQLPLA